ncbi:MAG: citronellyl-CoA synthetase [Sulfitobacter sp.]|jgi:citronellyl-CoA synthetase
MPKISQIMSATKVLLTEIIPLAYDITRNPIKDEDLDNLPLRLAKTAANFPSKTAIIFEGREITWGQLDERVSRVAQSLQDRGIKLGDAVSLLMDNRIEFIESLFGIMRAGAVASLINTNLRGPQLIHCITETKAKALIFGAELTDAVAEIKADCELMEGDDFLFVSDTNNNDAPNWAIDYKRVIDDTQPMPVNVRPEITGGDSALFIFTSGTTGLPKATIQKHAKQLILPKVTSTAGLKLRSSDCMYLCLPLYHTTGLSLGFNSAMSAGTTIFIRRKFSASQFLHDVRTHNCNTFLYIGELCRYLLAQPELPGDGENPIEKMMGNGLRPDIWMKFKDRYKIDKIVELYGASEGNSMLLNLFNRDCTIGTTILPMPLIRYDVAADVILRDESGFCIPVEAGQPGLFIGEITENTEFVGYTDKEATQKKILRDVFKPGDAYFNSGDLLRTIDAGFAFGMKHYQFVDRIGDTFRWKGENCSTNEVGEIINNHTSIEICNIFGVEIPNTDGRAGMAAIVLKEGHEFDASSISALIKRDLAAYAQPVFIRILPELPLTGTFKMQKGDLREAAYHPDQCPDPVYVLKPGEDTYIELDAQFYQKILSAEAGY